MYTILVVDDKPSQVDMLCVMLAQLNVECISAYSGIEAVEIARETQPNLIIMDWIMPADTLTGHDATQQILLDNNTHHIPVIACSAAIKDFNEVLHVGCVDYIAKPFSLSSLLDKVQQYLN